jgi:Protein kinase domain
MHQDEIEDRTPTSAGSNPKGWLRRLLNGLLRAGDSPEPPKRLGRYRLLHELGQGGMGIVFVAEDDSLGRRVAVKTIAAADGTARQRFRQEARVAACVNHPNMCQIYEIGEDAGRLFIAMELLQDELSERIVESLSPSLAGREGARRRNVAASARAYEEGESEDSFEEMLRFDLPISAGLTRSPEPCLPEC